MFEGDGGGGRGSASDCPNAFASNAPTSARDIVFVALINDDSKAEGNGALFLLKALMDASIWFKRSALDMAMAL